MASNRLSLVISEPSVSVSNITYSEAIIGVTAVQQESACLNTDFTVKFVYLQNQPQGFLNHKVTVLLMPSASKKLDIKGEPHDFTKL